MRTASGRGFKRSFLALSLAGFVVSQFPACGGNTTTSGAKGSGGTSASGGVTGSSSTVGSGGSTGSGGTVATGGKTGTGGASATGGRTGTDGTTGSGGGPATGGTGSATSKDAGSLAGDAPQTDKYVVAMVQSTKANASDLTAQDVADLVGSAVSKAGGIDFIKTGQTVVLKPNLVTAYTDHYRMAPADLTVNGIATDWRVVKAVADLVRPKVGSTGKILVMEGSTMSTPTAYSMLGYTKANISAVDEFVALEGTACTDRTTTALVQKTGKSGTQYWVNKRYVEADVVISMPTMKTHLAAGITGSVKNLGIGTTPMGQFSLASANTNASDCTRGQAAGANSIDHSTPESLGSFIRDYFSLHPADFVVMDALQGLEHGPAPAFEPKGDAGYYDYASSKKNMRLILAGQNAVAVDTIEALVMKCDPKKVPHLTKLEADGLGTTDTAKIEVVGKQVSEVAKPFAGKLTDICPGT